MRRQRRAEKSSLDTIVWVSLIAIGGVVCLIPFGKPNPKEIPYEIIQASPIIGVLMVITGIVMSAITRR